MHGCQHLLLLLSVVIESGICLEHYCPGDEITLTPSYLASSKWHGWSCRQHSMTYFGNIKDLNSIDFNAIENANKTTLRIHIKDSYKTKIHSDIFSPLQSLKHLDLHLNSTLIPSGLFTSLRSLETLNLITYNEELPPDLFGWLPNLRTLKVHIRQKGIRLRKEHKKLPHFDAFKHDTTDTRLNQLLPDDIFHKLPQLEKLYIHCRCTYIPISLLSKNYNLKRLHLHTNFGTLDKSFFDNNQLLEHLNIKAYAYISINKNLLKPLSNLVSLTLTARDISIAHNSFESNTNMAIIFISGRIQTLPENIFDPLENLLTLDLGATGLTYVDENLISNNTKLFYLRLEDNELTTIPINFFRNNDKLTTLLLDDNDFASLPYDVFKPLTELEDIYLHGNKNFEMFCDYHFSNKTIFPKLDSIHLHGMAHSCRHPWVKSLMEQRPKVHVLYHRISNYDRLQHETTGDIEFDEEYDKKEDLDKSNKLSDLIKNGMPDCPSILMQIDTKDMTKDYKIYINQPIKIKFIGPKRFVNHKAYWVSTKLTPCRSFHDPSIFDKNFIGHDIVQIKKDGGAKIRFKTPGEYYLVYKYGSDIPFIPYPNFRVTVQKFSLV